MWLDIETAVMDGNSLGKLVVYEIGTHYISTIQALDLPDLQCRDCELHVSVLPLVKNWLLFPPADVD